MHILIALLTAIGGILFWMHRLAQMGISLGGLNPFLWNRRRKWKMTYNANPIFRLESPMEASALLVTAAAKADGDMSSEEKSEILSIFSQEFHLSERDAASLLVSSVHLLGAGDEVRENLGGVLEASLPNFTPDQASSALSLMEHITQVGGSSTESQRELIANARLILQATNQQSGKWQ